MTITDDIGSAAATLTTIAFIPQVWKVWRTKHTADISMGMYVLFTIGVALWLAYGILSRIMADHHGQLIHAGIGGCRIGNEKRVRLKQKHNMNQVYEIKPDQSIELLKELHILTRDGKLNQDSRRKLKQVYHLFHFIEPLLNEVLAAKKNLTLADPRRRQILPGFHHL